MTRKLLYEGILLILIFGSIWGLLMLFPIWPKESKIELSIEKEKDLGDLLLRAFIADSEKERNDSLKSSLETVLTRLTSSLDSTRYVYELVVVHDEMANAFAFPGGIIVVTEPLLEILDTPQEFAAVLAHEMGHIEKKHTISKLLAQFTMVLVFSDTGLATEAARAITSTAFSRRQEEDADRFGLELLEKAAIHPMAMGRAFRQLKEHDNKYSLSIEILSSHPDLDSRIKKAYSYPVGDDFSERAIDVDWQQVQQSVK